MCQICASAVSLVSTSEGQADPSMYFAGDEHMSQQARKESRLLKSGQQQQMAMDTAMQQGELMRKGVGMMHPQEEGRRGDRDLRL